VSPALYRDRSSPAVAARVGRVVGILEDSGLEGPSDYVSYTGVTLETLNGNAAPVLKWGDRSRPAPDSQSTNVLQSELALLIGFPSLLFLRAASRLSAATRARRLSALRLVGAARAQILHTAALEGSVPGLVGSAIGLAMYAGVNVVLARSGWFGFTWFQNSTALTLTSCIAGVLLVTVLSGFLGMAGTRDLLDNPLRTRAGSSRRVPVVIKCLPLALGLGMLVVLTIAVGDASKRPEPSRTTLIAIALASVGVIWLIAPTTLSLGALWLRRRPSLGLRLAVRRLQHESGSATRLVTAVVSLILVAGMSQAVLRTIYLVAGVTNPSASLEISGRELLNTAQRQRVASLPAAHRVPLEHSIQQRTPVGTPGSPQYFANAFGADVYYMTCADFRIASSSPARGCQEGSSYLLEDSPSALTRQLQPGVQLQMASGPLVVPSRVLTVPQLFSNVLLHHDSVLVTGSDATTHTWSPNSIFRFAVPTAALEQLETEIAQINPAAQVSIFNQDLTKLELYRIHRGSINLGTILGLLLGLTSLVVTVVDRVSERRRAVAVLAVVGTPLALLRRAQALQLAIPLVVGIVPAIFVAALSSDRYIRLEGTLQSGYFFGSVAWVLAMSGVGAVVAIGSAMVVAGRTPTSEELRQE
jgi:hypothetical protein